MAKTFSWGEVVENKRKTSTGGGSSNIGNTGNYFVGDDLKYEMGELKRITIPYVLDEEGKEKMLIFSAPVHKIVDRGFIKLTGPKGNEYTPYSIRCMGALAQVDYSKGKEIAERGQYCTLCTLANLQTASRFARIEEKYGSIEAFKAIPKENPDKKTFIEALNEGDKVLESYNSSKKETFYETYILVLELESTTKSVAGDFGVEKVTSVKLDADGTPIWKPTLLKATAKRLEKFQKAFQEAGRLRQLEVSSLHPFVDQTGAEVKTAFIDFELEFPVREKKMNSAADLEIRAVPTAQSCVTQDFIDKILAQSATLIEKSETAWVNSHSRLQEFTNEEYVSYMADKGAYLNQLKELYLTDRDREFARKILLTAMGDNQFAKSEDSEEEVAEVPTEAVNKDAVASKSDLLEDDLLGVDLPF